MDPVLISGERTDKNRSEAEFRAEKQTALEKQAELDCKEAVTRLDPINSLINSMFENGFVGPR